MMIEVLKSKIHCARVTEANLNYMGSITIDEDLMDAANMIAGEKVYIADNNNGERFETYIIKGERGSGKICLNGAAARRVQPDDIVIIMSYAWMDFEEAKSFKPTVVFPDPTTNKIVDWNESIFYCWKLEYLNQYDVHANNKERVNGVVMNTDRWYEVFGVQRGDILYLSPERRGHIW